VLHEGGARALSPRGAALASLASQVAALGAAGDPTGARVLYEALGRLLDGVVAGEEVYTPVFCTSYSSQYNSAMTLSSSHISTR
jgi:hypothetical protein